MNYSNIIKENSTLFVFIVLFLILYYIAYFYFYKKYKKEKNINNIDIELNNIKNIHTLAENYDAHITHSDRKAMPVINDNLKKSENWRDTYNDIQELDYKIKLDNQLTNFLGKNDIEIND